MSTLQQNQQNLFRQEYSEIHKFINFILNEQEFPEQLKESTIVPVDVGLLGRITV